MNKYIEKVAEIVYTYELNQPDPHPDFLAGLKTEISDDMNRYRNGKIDRQDLIDNVVDTSRHYAENGWVKNDVLQRFNDNHVSLMEEKYPALYAQGREHYKVRAPLTGAAVTGSISALYGGILGGPTGAVGAGLAGAALGGVMGHFIGKSQARYDADNKIIRQIMREDK